MVAGFFVLVVDDEEDSRQILGMLLRLAGYEVDTLDSGHRVVDRAALLSPAVILLDIVMPGVSGFEAARRLRADERTRHIPLIAVSGRIKEEEAHEGGFEQFHQKGKDPRELLRRVQEAVGV
jgi:CheY-like chemotaxis protein